MLYKIIGVLFLIIGAWIVIYFPEKGDYQHEAMTKAGVWLGIVFFILGLLMILM